MLVLYERSEQACTILLKTTQRLFHDDLGKRGTVFTQLRDSDMISNTS